MDVPAKLRSASVNIRCLLFTFLLLATATFLVACGTDGTKKVRVIAQDIDIGSIVLTIEDDSLEAGGITTVVTAEVLTVDGNPVADGTTVNFAITPIGNIPAAAATKNGIAKTMLTSDTIAGQYTLTATAGTAKAIAFGEFVPASADAANTFLTANPNSIQADGVSTSLITLVAQDAYNNPVIDGTPVNFYADKGTPLSDTGVTSNGIATFTLTSSTDDNTVATVTAIVGQATKTVQVGFGAVVGGGEGSGTANSIFLNIEPTSIRVKNSGGNETSVITATVIDEEGAAITDCGPENNIRFAIINGPGGGEKLDGMGSIVKKYTVNGVATATLSSGTVSGSVNIQVSVILNGECTDADIPASGYYATAYSSNVVIEAGGPAYITIFEDIDLTNNDDGSISKTINAQVRDLHGNPVENGTAVYFGLVDNLNSALPPYLGYISAGTDGVTNGTTTFTSAGSIFITDGLKAEDILIILEGRDEGGHRIASVNNNTSLTLYATMNGSQTGLNFVAGYAELGTVCGSAQTGNLVMDASCTPTTVGGPGSIKGVAHTKLTWVPRGIFKPFYLYAESVGGEVGDTLANVYYGVAPLSVNVAVVPDSVSSGTGGSNLIVQVVVEDGADHDIQGELVTFYTGDVTKANFGGAISDSAITDINGFASVSTLDIIMYDEGDPMVEGDETGCGPGDSVTITTSFGGEATVSCQ